MAVGLWPVSLSIAQYIETWGLRMLQFFNMGQNITGRLMSCFSLVESGVPGVADQHIRRHWICPTADDPFVYI